MQKFVQVAFVAGIFEECILGLDFLQANGCSLDLKSHTLDVNVFASSLETGRTGAAQRRIDAGNAAPIKQQPRRIPLAKPVPTATSYTPAMLLMGRELRLPAGITFGTPVLPSRETTRRVLYSDYSRHLRTKLNCVHDFARRHLHLSSESARTRYNRSCSGRILQPGDKVWLHQPRRTKGRCPKLQPNWEGPYEVVKRLNDVVYRVRHLLSRKVHVVYFDRLVPYQPD
ncbi:unnamed protein product [Ixodes pacificus]